MRGGAIVMVLISHCGAVFAGWYGVAFPWQLAVLGFYGVRLFFVLSGFLIGGLLIRAAARPVSVRGWRLFMIRRWMRTLPLYLAVLLWPLHSAHQLLMPPGTRGGAGAFLAYLAQVQNLAWAPIPFWFTVAWSLAVEEWFYLLFSASFLALAFHRGTRTGFWITVAGFALIPLLSRLALPLSVDWDNLTSKAVVLQLDAFVPGLVLAWISARKAIPPWGAVLAGILGLALLWVVFTGRLEQATGQRIAHAIIFTVTGIGVAACIPALRHLPPAPSWISAPATALSAISYSLYLTHLLVLVSVDHWRIAQGMAPAPAIVLTLALTLGVATLGTLLVERPFMRLRPPMDGRVFASANSVER